MDVLVALLCLLCSARASLLLVVGSVSHNTARILVDWDAEAAGRPVLLPVWILPGLDTLLPQDRPFNTSVVLSDGPVALVLDGLNPDTVYRVVVGSSDDTVTFVTVAHSPWRAVLLSCDRFLEDGDDEFVLQLGAEQNRSYTLMIHMGDQVLQQAWPY